MNSARQEDGRGHFEGPVRIVAGLVLAVLAYIALDGAFVAMASPLPMRGEMVDIGGRRLHLICEGPKGAGPSVNQSFKR